MNNIAVVWQRILAYLIDVSFILILPLYLLSGLAAINDPTEVLNRFWPYLFFVVLLYPIIYALFVSFMVSSFGGTLGKLLTGTRIVSSDGRKLKFWKAFFRNHIGYMVSGMLLGMGFIWILIDKERRGWHDQIANTYVVNVNKLLGYVGAVIIILMFLAEYSLINTSISNFRKNKDTYIDIVNTTFEMFSNEDSSRETSPIPVDSENVPYKEVPSAYTF
jgi:uncharacterized RDD family membrane protein YckC